MQRIIGYVLDKFSELGPVRKLFKFFFGRIFDNLIDREIKLSDFKNNILELENLPLSTSKINKVYLSDSPYKLHSGVIGKLRIKIASFKELTTQDIEVSLDKIHLVFNFNTNYHKQKNFQMNQVNKVTEPEVQDIDLRDEDDEDEGINIDPTQQKQGKQDMFKQFIRQVLSNIKLSINDLVIDLCMNDPTTTAKKQAYIMLRLKRLKIYQQKKELIHKKLKVVKDKSENLYWIKLKEISAFIIKPNESSEKEFPFNFPGINDIQCIFTTSFKMKQFRSAFENQDKKFMDNLHQSYLFDYNASMIERDIKNQNADDEAFLPNHFQVETLFNPNDASVKSVKAYIPPIEIQLDPVQLNVLLNFSDQLKSYTQMKKINEYKKNNFSQKDLLLYNMIPNQSKQYRQENKMKDEDDYDFTQHIKNNISNQQFLKAEHFKLQSIANASNQSGENEGASPLKLSEQKENLSQSGNANKNINDSSSEEYNFINEIQFDFYNTQFDFKIYAVNVYLLKKEIKIDSYNKILFKTDGSNDTELSNSYFYSRNWIYYYDELQEKILNGMQFVSQQQQQQQNQRIFIDQSKMKETSSNVFIDRTSFNDGIPSSYFLFSLKSFKVMTQSKTKKTISIQSIKCLDVNIVENRGVLPTTLVQNLKPNGVQSQQAAGTLHRNQYLSSIQKSSNICEQKQAFEVQNSQINKSIIKEQSVRDSNFSDSQFFKSIINSDQADEELFYSMQDNQILQSIHQSNRQASTLERIVEEEVEVKKQTVDLKQWRIDCQNQHYCISYIILIKGEKKKVPSNKGLSNINATPASSKIFFKQSILNQSQWQIQGPKKESQPSPYALEIELIKKGQTIQAQAQIKDIYLSFDLRILRDFYHIRYPCEEWGKFTQDYLAYDLKLQNTESISLLDDYLKQTEQIEFYMKAKKQTQASQSNTNKKNESEQKAAEEPLSIQFSLNINKIKCVFFSYHEKADLKQIFQRFEYNKNPSEICFNNQTCFCSHLVEGARKNKKYLYENFACELTNLNIEFNSLPNQPNILSFSMDKANIGLLKINKDQSLESTEPIFKFNNLVDMESVKINVKMISYIKNILLKQNVLNVINLKIGSLQINIWNIEKIMSFVNSTQQLLIKYQTLLEYLQKLEREQKRLQKSFYDKDKVNEELKSVDGSDQEDEVRQELDLQFNYQFIKGENLVQNDTFLNETELNVNINKVDIRIIYQQHYKAECEDRKNSTISVFPDKTNKMRLMDYLFKDKSNQIKGGQQQVQYQPIQNQLIPQNCVLQLIIRHTFMQLQQGSDLVLKIYEIYLVDNLQTQINLGNYKKSANYEDQTYSQQSRLSIDQEELEYKIIIYSTSFYDPSLCEEEWNRKQNNKSMQMVIDVDNPQNINRPSFGDNDQRQRAQSFSQRNLIQECPEVFSSAIFIKASYRVEVQNIKVKNESQQSPLKKMNVNLNSQPSQPNKENNDLDTSIISEDGNMQEQVEQTIQKQTTHLTITEISISDFKIRFGDFRSEMIDNLLQLTKMLSSEQVQDNIDDIDKKPEQKNIILQMPQLASSPKKKEAQIVQQGIKLQIKNVIIQDIVLDLFPFHDADIRKKLPKVYENVAEENKKKAFYTNQRSIIRLKNLTMKKLIYDSFTEIIEFNLSLEELELYTLIFDDYKQYLNPLILGRQNYILKENSLESQLHLDKKGYGFVDQIQALGFQNVMDISSQISLSYSKNKFDLRLSLQKLGISSCKDSLLAFPLHITLLTLLFERMFQPLTKQESLTQSNQNDKVNSQKQNNQSNQSQSKEKAEISNQNPLKPNNNPIQSEKGKNIAQDYDFEEIGEEFLIEEKDNYSFLQNANNQSLEYFHKQGLEDQISATTVEFKVKNLEIQIYSGKDFDFEHKFKSLSQAERRRNTTRKYKQNLLLVLDTILLLYSQFPIKKKIGLSIQSIDLQGTVDNKSEMIIMKKENLKQMVLIDIMIDDISKLISMRAYLAKIQVVVDKVHKQLFEDLSQMQIDLEQIAVSKKEEISEVSIFNNASRLHSSHNDNYQDIQLNDDNNDVQFDDEEEDDDDDEYEIYDHSMNQDQINNRQYKFQLIYISPLQFEVTVNWFVNSILKDSQLIFDELYLSNDQGILLDGNLIQELQSHYTKLFDIHITKNNQLLKLVKDVVFIRNVTNLTKSLANVFILPYKSFRNTGKISSGLIEGVKGFQQSVFAETRNFFSMASGIYSQYISKNMIGFKKLKTFLKNKKQK